MRVLFKEKNLGKKSFSSIFLILIIIFSISLLSVDIKKNSQINYKIYKDNINVKPSSLIGEINLTSDWIDNKMFTHNQGFKLEGNLDLFGIDDESGKIIAIKIDNHVNKLYNATTEENGTFQINYIVSDNLSVYSKHIIKAQVISDIGGDLIICKNNFTINVNTTSYFDISGTFAPYSPGEGYDINGFIRFGNGTGISNARIYYQWTNLSSIWVNNSIFSNPDGSLPNIPVPSNATLGQLNFSMQFQKIPDKVESSETKIKNIDIFMNITVTWNTPTEATEGQSIRIAGQISAAGNNSLKISNREFNLYIDAQLIGILTTDDAGNFSFNYRLPLGSGNRILRIELQGNANLDSNLNLTVSQNILLPLLLIRTPESGITITPRQWFLIIGVPSIIVAAIIIGIMGYLYYRKKIISSKVVTIPLEGKIENLKILKDSGRIEEALTYLFSAIYMELVAGKFGRKRNASETIRDFGIISVKEFGLDATKIYPFIQKIESIIYARPTPLADEDFYNTIELFSPIYYLLTGYNFILNF